MSGVVYGAIFGLADKVRVELYIDVGDAERNRALFDWLSGKKEEIEEKLATRLEWERLDDRRASRIAAYRPDSIEANEAELEHTRVWFIKELLAFREVFGPLLKQYSKSPTIPPASPRPAQVGCCQGGEGGALSSHCGQTAR